MRVVICASVRCGAEIESARDQLIAHGHTVFWPQRESSEGPLSAAQHRALIERHLQEIARSNMILVVNPARDGQEGYIGPSVLLEMGLAVYLKVPVIVLYPIAPTLPTAPEAMALCDQQLHGHLERWLEEHAALDK